MADKVPGQWNAVYLWDQGADKENAIYEPFA